jgi:hypothetical protein
VNPLKNIVLNLQATGPSAVISIWIICLTVLAVFAPENGNSKTVLTILTIVGGSLTAGLAFRQDGSRS